MIIDAHHHLVGKGWYTEDVKNGIAYFIAPQMGLNPNDFETHEKFLEELFENFYDESGDKLIENMNGANIDKTCIFTIDYEIPCGKPDVSIDEQNEKIANAAKKHEGRLIPFYNIDPRQKHAKKRFEKALKKDGMKGLKLHPTTGFFPYDKCCYPLYELCLEYNVPVIFHSGPMIPPLKSRFSRPINMDDVATDFPDLKIILARIGSYFWEETLAIATVKPNIYVDFSVWQSKFLTKPKFFYQVLRDTIDTMGPDRVFWGSDGPFFEPILSNDKWIDAVLNPDPEKSDGVTFSKEEKEIILGKGFAKLLGI
jgi:uncharacterized protein